MSSVPVALSGTGEIPIPVDVRETEGVRRILFFDGVCGLCNWSIDFVMKRDYRKQFQFAPLQGDTAKSLLSPADVNNLDTMVLWVAGRTYRKSAAVIRILWQLGPGWRVLGVLLWLIPLPLRNLGYTIVAKNRYRVFGKKESCRLPTPEERTRFLP
ncbi:thiol-disulfide oxidoreductase DCC family protein [Schlesneria sp. T3-172]|uniref:thiol-disulfide oxidoreductase DCC family protein n=1 Tax=Schlesneria sphaerica TaxID=3373610 RepID=UPI0037C753AB